MWLDFAFCATYALYWCCIGSLLMCISASQTFWSRKQPNFQFDVVTSCFMISLAVTFYTTYATYWWCVGLLPSILAIPAFSVPKKPHSLFHEATCCIVTWLPVAIWYHLWYLSAMKRPSTKFGGIPSFLGPKIASFPVCWGHFLIHDVTS